MDATKSNSDNGKGIRILERIFSIFGVFEYAYKREIKYDNSLTKSLKTETEKY